MQKFLLINLISFIFLLVPTSSESYQPNPYQVKAALLYNFAKYVRWPESSFSQENKVVFGILGADPFGDSLDKLVKGKSIGGRKIVLKRFSEARDLEKTHLLFVNLPLKEFLKENKRISRKSSLTIGDVKGFIESGGVINFIDRPGRVSFEVNKKSAEEAGLEISSALLTLADKVVE